MAIKKQLRRRKKKGEGRPAQQFFQAAPSHEQAEGNATFFPPGAQLQKKLNVSQPGDPQEQEADRMADKVVQRAAESRSTSPQAHTHGIVPKAGGNALPPGTAAEMSSSFGYDFGKVRIHTDQQAQTAAAQLQAQAFTYGGDIYFNKDKYNPASKEGKWLLAHELTHVMQQQGQTLNIVQKKDVPEISTPVPKSLKVDKDKAGVVTGASGSVGKVNVIILPDTTGAVPAGKSAVTNITYHVTVPGTATKDGKISKINGKPTLDITIQTVYAPEVSPTSTSAYGRGTTKDDKKKKHTTLRFHEGSHGSFVFQYLAKYPVPLFGGAVGQTEEKYAEAGEKYVEKVAEYMAKLDAANEQAVDCVGTKEASCKP
jgi:hypothetical protein